MFRETNAQATDRCINKNVAQVSAANLEPTVQLIEARRRNGRRPSSNKHFLHHLLRFDAFLAGKPFALATAEDVTGFLNEVRGSGTKQRSVSTVKSAAVHIQAVIKHVYRVHDNADLPYEFRVAFKVARPKGNVRGAVIPEPAFLAALDAVPRLDYTSASATELIRCLLWLLWDSGMRIGELLSLRYSDVSFDEATATAKLQLREELTVSHGLKTGARYVILRDAVPALKTWMQLHPGRLDPEAPLLSSLGYFKHVRGLNHDTVNRVIRQVFALVGAKPVGARKSFSAHDFRHTAATRDARNGYREPALRLKYGWSGTSPMPAHYVHLSEDDARARVLATPATGAAPVASPSAVAVAPVAARPVQRIVPASDLEALILSGWRFLANVGPDRFIVEAPASVGAWAPVAAAALTAPSVEVASPAGPTVPSDAPAVPVEAPGAATRAALAVA